MSFFHTGLIIAIVLFTQQVLLSQDIRAVTEDGKKAILHGNGAWEYDTTTKTGSDKAILKSNLAGYLLNYNPAVWTLKENGESNPNAEFELEHVTKEAYALMITDKSNLPVIALKKVSMDKLRSTATDIQVLEDSVQTVNGAEVTITKIKATIQDMTFIYCSLYRSTSKGAVQLTAFTLEQYYKDYSKDFEELFLGLIAL